MDNLRLFKTTRQYNDARSGFAWPTVSWITDDNIVYYMKKPVPENRYKHEYLTFEMLEDGNLYVSFDVGAEGETPSSFSLSYSLDEGATWVDENSTLIEQPGEDWADNVIEITLSDLSAGDKVLFKGDINLNLDYDQPYFNFTTTTYEYDEQLDEDVETSSEFNISGNPMSVYDGENFGDIDELMIPDCFSNWFSGSKVISAENLYLGFSALSEYCYSNMFNYCTSLTTAPELPATTLVTNCYREMFRNCSNLTSVEIYCGSGTLPGDNYTYYWLDNVAASGTFYRHTTWKHIVGPSTIPSGWTVIFVPNQI